MRIIGFPGTAPFSDGNSRRSRAWLGNQVMWGQPGFCDGWRAPPPSTAGWEDARCNGRQVSFLFIQLLGDIFLYHPDALWENKMRILKRMRRYFVSMGADFFECIVLWPRSTIWVSLLFILGCLDKVQTCWTTGMVLLEMESTVGKFVHFQMIPHLTFTFAFKGLKWVQEGDGWLKVTGHQQNKFKEENMLRASGYLRTTCRLFRLASAPSIYCSLRGCGCHGSQVLCLSPAKS